MAGSLMTFSYVNIGPIRKVIVDWLSDDSTSAVDGTTTQTICGTLIKAITNPGSAAPTDNYDIAITDEELHDVLANSQSTLANRDTTNTEEVYFMELDAAAVTPLAQGVQPVVCDRLKFAVTAAGNAKTGRIVLYYKAG